MNKLILSALMAMMLFVFCKPEIPNSTMAKYNVIPSVKANHNGHWPSCTKTYPLSPYNPERSQTYIYHRVTFTLDIGALNYHGRKFWIGLWMDERYPWNSEYLPVESLDTLEAVDTLWNFEQVLTAAEILRSPRGDSCGIWYPTYIKNLYIRQYADSLGNYKPRKAERYFELSDLD